MFNGDKRKFLFRCEDCQTIVSIELLEEEIKKAQENDLIVECPCGSQCSLLRD